MFKKHEFDIESFYKLGELLFHQNLNLQNSDIQEGLYRTIISRYYYYVFLKIRNMILTYDKNKANIFKSKDTHRLVGSYLVALDDILELNGELEDIAKTLGKLRKLRNDADYKTHKKITIEDVNQAKAWVDDMILCLKSIKFENITGFENILSYIELLKDCKGCKTYQHGIRFPKINKMHDFE